ncbi:thiamine phosphate synthase [Bergeriella denitrificans]|uniref:Thiamine-phosphate synthase n=1 Tax=Bergeriella denitrificans TaxID=494 RepID=A0A378UI21_BERDE|nr:thiamine phosphate synthase [Bergeriella denitrificans]STZ76141.1 thiamin-phosphate pyrophosphorylase [Bergeriella denitrificans]
MKPNIRAMLACYFVAGSQDFQGTPDERAAKLLDVLAQALAGGITCFQFRDKGAGSLAHQPKQRQALAERCRDLCRRHQVPFFIDDDLDLALAVGADGIHVGQEDTPPAEIRRRAGQSLIIGLSTHTLAQLAQAEADAEADYCGLGPVFPTASKEKHRPPVGLDFVREARAAGITLPIVMIGGIREEHIPILAANGADGAAVISAITQADDVAETVKRLKAAALGEAQ